MYGELQRQLADACNTAIQEYWIHIFSLRIFVDSILTVCICPASPFSRGINPLVSFGPSQPTSLASMAIITSLEEIVKSKVDDPRKACETNRTGDAQGLICKRPVDKSAYAPPLGAMMAAAVYYDTAGVVEFCLEQGGPEAVQDPVMTFVAQRSAWKSYRLVIERKAVDINYVIPWYGDVLGNAATHDNLTIARFCLQHGADPNRNKVEEYMSVVGATAELGHLEMVQLLLNHGAVLHGSGASVLAGEKGQKDMVKLLLAKGADINEMGVEDP